MPPSSIASNGPRRRESRADEGLPSPRKSIAGTARRSLQPLTHETGIGRPRPQCATRHSPETGWMPGDRSPAVHFISHTTLAFAHGDGAWRCLVYPPMPQSLYVQNDGSVFTRLNSAAGVKPVILRAWRIMWDWSA